MWLGWGKQAMYTEFWWGKLVENGQLIISRNWKCRINIDRREAVRIDGTG
jgi:hypothetical protein